MTPAPGLARFCRSLYAALFALALFGFPAISTLPVFMGVESRPISVAYRAFVLVSSLALLLLAVFRGRSFIGRAPAIFSLALMGVMSARLVWDCAASSLPLDLNCTEFASFSFAVTFLPALAFLVRADQTTLDRAFNAAVWLGAATIGLLVVASLVALSDLSALGRLTTGVLNSITIGHVGVSMFVLLAFGPLRSIPPKPVAVSRAWLRYGGLAASAALVLASASKGPLLVWVLVLTGWLLAVVRSARKGRATWRAIVLPILFIAALPLTVILVNSIVPLSIFERVVSFLVDPSTSDRLRILSQALMQFEESPLLGSAAVELSARFYPHNVVVESLMAGGLLAFGLLMALLVRSSAAAASVGFLQGRNCWIPWLFLQFVVDAMFSGSLYFSPQFWVLTLVVLGLERPKRESSLDRSLAGVHR